MAKNIALKIWVLISGSNLIFERLCPYLWGRLLFSTPPPVHKTDTPLSEIMPNQHRVGGKGQSGTIYMEPLFCVIQSAPPFLLPSPFGREAGDERLLAPRLRVAPSSSWLEGGLSSCPPFRTGESGPHQKITNRTHFPATGRRVWQYSEYFQPWSRPLFGTIGVFSFTTNLSPPRRRGSIRTPPKDGFPPAGVLKKTTNLKGPCFLQNGGIRKSLTGGRSQFRLRRNQDLPQPFP